LERLGETRITSISAPTGRADLLLSTQYDARREELLRRFIFNFSKKYAVLTAAAITGVGAVNPAFGFTYAYALPSDFVRLLALGDVTLNADVEAELYDISDGYIYCDEGETDSVTAAVELKVQYVYSAETVTKFDALFIRCLALQLAADCAYALTKKQSVVDAVNRELADALVAAGAIAGQEKPPRRIQRSRWLDNRRMGGSFRNVTRHPI
jgi:hypothetical protein